MNSTGRIEFWFDFGSNYSYLAAMRIEPLAAQYGIAIEWRPFLLGAIFRSFGWETSPFVLQRLKGDYVWKDMQRQCTKYRLAWRRPTVFPRGSVLAHRVALCVASESWAGEFCRRIMTMNFAEDRDIESAEAVTLALAGLVDDPGAVIAQAQHDDNKLGLRRQTEEATARGIFGAPTFFAGPEMFWGNDRLDDALAACRADADAERSVANSGKPEARPHPGEGS